jgi:hypothetical protein
MLGLFGLVGGTVGSYIPTIWGGSLLGVSSLAFGVLGGIAGVILGARLLDV